MTVRILVGDCIRRLQELPEASVHCVVTSPPYWGLRDYGHQGQIGLEATWQEYIEHIVAVFREARRVLRNDGTLWLNLGDCYATGAGKVGDAPGGGAQGERWRGGNEGKHGRVGPQTQANRMPQEGLKPKDLAGMPWRVAFALQADGWYLRSDIIWHKPNPMPESVTDRPTKSHEYLFLLSKSERYYYDADAIKEPVEWEPQHRNVDSISKSFVPGAARHTGLHKRSGNKARRPAAERGVPVADNDSTNGAVAGSVPWHGTTRNKRTVWTVPTRPFSGAHFATFPPDLIEPCILAGCPEGGTVLDPFGGAGTTGLVAARHHRSAILIEINPEYAAMAVRRIEEDAPLLANVVLDA